MVIYKSEHQKVIQKLQSNGLREKVEVSILFLVSFNDMKLLRDCTNPLRSTIRTTARSIVAICRNIIEFLDFIVYLIHS